MKFIMTTNKNWGRVALCAMAIGSYAHSSETSVAIIKVTGSFIVKVEQILSQFFNANSNISYKDCVTILGNALTEIENKIKVAVENGSDDLTNKAYDIAQEARKHFNAAYSVIRQYQDKPSNDASRFVKDIQRVFSVDIAFNAITTKLRNLLKDAESTGQSELVHVIQQLLLVLEKKNAEWKNKGLSLLTGLSKRMSCK